MKNKKKMIILIAAVIVVLAAVAFMVSGLSGLTFNKNIYLRITNQTDGDLYKYWMYYSYRGEVFPHAESAIGCDNPVSGSNTCKPIAVGESVKLNMEPNPNYITYTPENMTLELYVFDDPINNREDGELENGVKVGEAYTFPVEAGKCVELVVTGNREDGFKMEVTGYSNWLFH